MSPLPVLDAPEAAVFVPGLLGAGILVSLALVVSDLVTAVRGQRARQRRAGAMAADVAREVVGAAPAAVPPPRAAVASRLACAVAGVACAGLGGYVVVGAFFNYWDLPIGTRWSDHVAWLWALLNVAALAFLVVGVGALALARGPERAPAWTTALVRRTPLGRPGRRAR